MVNPKKPPTETFRITKNLARKIRVISAARGVSIPDWLEETFGPLVEREFSKVAKGLAKEADSPKE